MSTIGQSVFRTLALTVICIAGFGFAFGCSNGTVANRTIASRYRFETSSRGRELNDRICRFPVEQRLAIVEQMLSTGTISKTEYAQMRIIYAGQQELAEAKREQQIAQEKERIARAAVAQEQARDWAALTPEQRLNLQMRGRELRARQLDQYETRSILDRQRRDADWAAERQRSDADFREINEYYDNQRREKQQRQQAEDTTRALDDIANELRWRRR